MKKLVFMLCCLLSSLWLRAQESEVTITGDIPTELHRIYAPLDKSQVPTGFLLEQAIPFAEIKDFDGQTLQDYNRVDIDRFGMIYATMYAATVQAAQKLPEPTVYMDKIRTANKSNVPLSFLFMDYNELDSNAVIDNLLTYSNGQLYDVPNRSRHPYLNNTLFIASPLLNQFKKGDVVTFSLSNDLLIGNRKASIRSIDVDLGNGFRNLNVGSTITTTFNVGGLKPIVFRITDNIGRVYTAHSQVNIEDSANSGLRGYSETPDDDFFIDKNAGARMQIFYACASQKKLRKPFVILDGYDPPEKGSNRGFNAFIERLEAEKDPINPNITLLDRIYEEEYDVIFIDWIDGADDLSRNAEVTIEAIKKMNELKKANGSTEKNFIIGASMGGVIGKLALSLMEERNEDHETDVYLNLDGPMLGANLPMGIQYMAKHFTDFAVNSVNYLTWPFDGTKKVKDFVHSLKLFETIMNRPATQQLLMLHCYATPNGKLIHSSHRDFYDMFRKRTLTKCRYVCLSNGSGIGERQIYDAGEKLMDIDLNGRDFRQLAAAIAEEKRVGDFGQFAIKTLLLFSVPRFKVDLEIFAAPPAQTQGTVYDGRIKLLVRPPSLRISPIFIWLSTSNTTKINNCPAIDHAPGGTLGDIFGRLVSLTNRFPVLNSSIQVASVGFGFIPTVSSLDIRDPEAKNLFFNTSNVLTTTQSNITKLNDYHVSTDRSIEVYKDIRPGVFADNQPHAFPNKQNAPWLVNLIMQQDELAKLQVLNQIYNFGDAKIISNTNVSLTKTPNFIRNSIIVENNGQIWINKNNKIAFINDATMPTNSFNSEFTVNIKKGGRCVDQPTTVEVKNNGNIIIGEDNPNCIANLNILEDCTLNININGSCSMPNKGSIFIKSKGNLIQTNGNNNLYKVSKITVENGGLYKLTGGNLNLYDNSFIVIQKGGKMDILGGQLTLHDQSQVIVQQGATLTISAQGYALLSNSGKLIVEKGGIVQVLGSGRMHINVDAVADIQGQVVFRDNSECIIQHQGKMDISGVSSFESGTLAMKDNGSITTKKGTYFTVNSALELHAAMNITMNNQSSIHIASYATIKFLGKDDEVVIKGGADEAENTPIVLEGTSNWVVESAMWVRGSSYFKIFGNPLITSPVEKFALRGDGKRINSPFKMMELMEGATLEPRITTLIKDGKIIYHSGWGIVEDATHIELSEETTSSTFSNVYFKAEANSQYTVALQDVHTNNVPNHTEIVNCLFDGLDKGIWMIRETRTYKADIEVKNSTFKNMQVTGIDTKNVGSVLVKGCNMIASQKIPNTYVVDNFFVPEISKYATAIRFIGKNSYNQAVQDKLTIESSMIKNQVNWQSYPAWVATEFSPDEDYAEHPSGFPPKNQEMTLNEESYLVGLYGGTLVVDKASEIYDGYYGILAFPGESEGDPRGSMITIQGCSKIHDNYAAIVYDNEEVFLPFINHPVVLPCTVLLEKAQIVDNTWGIYGKNVIIDANLITQRSTNTFSIKDGLRHGHYVCIHYTSTASPSGGTSNNADLVAPINYWVNGTPQKGINYLLNRNYQIDPFPEAYQTALCSLTELVDYIDENEVMIEASALQKAEISVNGVTKSLLPIYWRGLTQHLKGQYEDAVTTMEEITDIPLSSIENSTNPYVHYYHNIAWSIASKQLQQSNIGKIIQHTTKQNNEWTVYPNPASESFTIQIANAAMYNVVISDMLGKAIKTMTISGFQTIGTTDMSAGMYQVTLKNQTDNTITTQKIVINK